MELTAKMITIDCAEPRELADWWAVVLGVEVAQDFGGFVILAARPLVLGFQRVPEEKLGKNRVHVDFSSADRGGEVNRLVGMGARVVGEHTAPEGLAWTTLQDPAGNEFCVSG
ncbi:MULTISPECIES: VOC family protein [unclassified Streptomyces]|uniref:VOC family protein n=1 Tax=Streptomyces sp. NBC_00180 TaxID=2903632 RepID=A0AAU1I9R1_9ACTN|nr:VOC family protein [Streptomyces sp. NBC_01017]WSV34769.1 VOC family protein [Streptomyces sp. NBC_01017]